MQIVFVSMVTWYSTRDELRIPWFETREYHPFTDIEFDFPKDSTSVVPRGYTGSFFMMPAYVVQYHVNSSSCHSDSNNSVESDTKDISFDDLKRVICFVNRFLVYMNNAMKFRVNCVRKSGLGRDF